MPSDSLNANARTWLDAGMTWADQYWDEDAGLLWTKPSSKRQYDLNVPDRLHLVRDTVWYVTGLLMRGDHDRAYKAIETVLRYQFDQPDAVYHGTFKRAPQEPNPPHNPTEWYDYDPNWREFICTILLMLMEEFDLPDSLQAQIWTAIRKAAAGAYARKVPAEYTNIALMSALLLDHAGAKLDVPEWRDHAETLARDIHDLFRQNNAFWEYNSPTYYGVDLYALAQWRVYGLTDTFRTLGTQMEADFWRDIAQFYHAGLRNLCGPYDRSYGMDMTRYVAVLGLWIALVVPPEKAPLPDPTQPFGHPHDFFYMPPTALLGTQVPDDALPHLLAFQGERQLERTIEADRVATAWLSENLMLGAETEHPSRLPDSQFHVATAHWQLPDGDVGWLRLRCDERVSARATPHMLAITCDEPRHIRFEIYAGDSDPNVIQGAEWSLPGVNVRLSLSDLAPQVSETRGELDVRLLDVAFDGPAGTFELRFTTG